MITKIEEVPTSPVKCQDCERARARSNNWAGYKAPAVPKAKYIIDDRKLCARHAGTRALDILLKEQR